MRKLLLHTCCAPCFTSVDERIRKLYEVAIFWYNPNIYPVEEYFKRLEQIKKIDHGHQVIEGDYLTDSRLWKEKVSPFADRQEGGERCQKCIEIRLEKTAQIAKLNHYDFFTTTLSVSPYKKSVLINEIGQRISKVYGIAWLSSDFKKQNGYLRSIELSKRFQLYRQNYCGCEFSLDQKAK